MVTDNTSSQDNTAETQPEAPQNLAPDTEVQGDVAVTQDVGNQLETPDGAESNEQPLAEPEDSNRSFSKEEVAKIQSAEHKNQQDLRQELENMQAKVKDLESKNREVEQKQTVDMIESNKIRYAQKLANDYVDQGYDQNAARKMATTQANQEAAIYMQRIELEGEKKRLEDQRAINQQENRLTTKHKIASKYGIDATQLDVFNTPEQMENYAKLAGKLVETGNQLVDNSPTHNSAESIAADGTPQNEQSLIQKYLRGDRSEAASGAVKRMMGR
tara:strand:+ start:5957 stop:6775 length:819 start_codon:yes stop_codon:yes gene_type:complete